MTDPQWRRVYELYARVGALPEEAARTALESSAEDPAVVDEVTVMLESLQRECDSSLTGHETPHPVYAGCTIGRYDVIALIGRGGTGEVYSGRDRELARPVALKFMSPEYASMESSASRFMREAQASSALNHPNIITVHEVISWNSSPVIVMELVEGTALRAIFGQSLPASRVIRIGSQIMQALAFAHSIGIVHRDLKPENVMVRPDGYIKVLDFGLARKTIFDPGRQDVSSTAGLPVGTLRYMSPEQCRGDSATPASDVFAAGVVLFEIIAGRHPFHADSPLDTAHAIVWSDPTPLTPLNPEVPPSITALIMRMLAKDAQARPSAADVAEALAIEEAVPISSSQTRRASRRYFIAGTAAVASLAVVLWASFRFSPSPRGSDRPVLPLPISPLANLPGAERQPSVSADATRVAFAFVGEKNTPSHIYIKTLADARLTRLTSDVLPDSHPVFSPDGTRLAFLRRARGRLRVMVMPSSGGVEQKVGEVVDLARKYVLMTWDARGQNLLISDGTSESRSEVAIFQISVDTGTRRQVTFPPPGASDYMPAVSSDGRSLGFARLVENGRGDLWAIPLAGGQERRLTDSQEVFLCWSWTPDSRDLLISYRRSGRVQLWRQPVSGGAQVRVAGLDDQVMELSVARNAGLLVYGSNIDEDHNINIWRYPIPPSTDPPKPLIASAAFDGDARYSPDGTRIAFASTRSGQFNIWVCAPDGTDLRQLTSLGLSGFTTGSPSWSPDGRWIAFDSRSPDAGSSIFLLDLLGGEPKRLTGPGSTDFVPGWSRDSRWVYFSSDRGGSQEIWKAPAGGGEPVQVTRNGGFEGFESSDGRFFYYTKRGLKNGFWRMSMNGGPETFVPELAGVANRNWENTPQGLYFVARSEPAQLHLLPSSGGEIKRVLDLSFQPSPVFHGLTIAPDGRSFLYMQVDLAKSNLMVVRNFH